MVNGEFKTVFVDAMVPLTHSRTVHNELWLPVLEKAWLKLCAGDSEVAAAESIEAVVRTITGSPLSVAEHAENDDQQIEQILTSELNSGKNLVFGYNRQDGKVVLHNKVFSHNGEVVVKVTDVWGTLDWQGEWGPNSSKWTGDLLALFENDQNPANLYFSLADYCTLFGQTISAKGAADLNLQEESQQLKLSH